MRFKRVVNSQNKRKYCPLFECPLIWLSKRISFVSSSIGYATREGDDWANLPKKHQINAVLAGKDGANAGTFTHELLHILMNTRHDSSARQYVFSAGTMPINDVNMKRRISARHETLIKKSRFLE